MQLRNIIILITLFLISCDKSSEESYDYDVLIINAQVVDVITNQVIPNQYVGINSDSIAIVGTMTSTTPTNNANVINAGGAFLMPGLWDNHVHFRGGDSLINENKNLLPLYLKYGITTVRDAGGDITPAILDWREGIKNDLLLGPTILTSGPKLDGTQPAWPGSIKVETEQDVMMALDSLEKLAVDYVKMYDGNLTKESFYSIIKEAEKRGLKTTGHMPLSADIIEAAKLGLDGSEHLYYVLKACASNADSLNQIEVDYSFISQIASSYDEERAEGVFKILAEENVFITPTLYIGSVLGNLLTNDHSTDSLLPYMGQGIIDSYQMRIERAKKAGASGAMGRLELGKVFSKMIKPMYDQGVHILAGSDGGAFNSYVYPGESLHGELRSLVESGLTPNQALVTSIVNGPMFFELDNKYGSITKGKKADLLLLKKNPLENIENLTTIQRVFLNGKTYSLYDIEKLIQE